MRENGSMSTVVIQMFMDMSDTQGRRTLNTRLHRYQSGSLCACVCVRERVISEDTLSNCSEGKGRVVQVVTSLEPTLT